MRSVFIVAAAGLIVAACSSQPTSEQNGAGVEDRTPKTTVTTPPVTQVQPEQKDLTGLAALRDPRSILSKRSIFFDFDQFVVKSEYRPLVEAHARFLVANTQMKILIQGNADERGSREYNLALGQKRAEAVKKSMLLLGAKEAQMEAVSLGEEKPRNTSHDEAAWAENRRSDILYSGEF